MSFLKQNIPFSETGFFSNLLIDYLNEDEKLKPFYHLPSTIESFTKKIEERKSSTVNRKLLVEVLKKQYSKNIDAPVTQIELLADENTFTITTGHQLNIFTGPLYFIYKIVSAIKLSTILKEKFPENNFIPVYWMATEDHDFEEINHIHVFDKTITWNLETKGACGRVSTETFQSIIEELKIVLGTSENATHLISIFENAYLKNSNLAAATRSLAHQLFGKYGLVILDADDADLKKSFSQIIKDELQNQFSFPLVSESSKLLEQHYKVQVSPRPINLFYLENNLRERIEKRDSNYVVLNTSIQFTEKEILKEIDNHPEKFSPNVVLRPLYQEMLLPNLAYIGGGAEVAYWMQLKSMFESKQVSFPILVLRDSVMVIDANQQNKITELKLRTHSIFESYDKQVKDFIHHQPETIADFKNESIAIESAFDSISSKIAETDSTLVNAVNAEKQKALNSIKSLEDKMLKAIKRKNETSLNQIKNINDKLFPHQQLQERHFNICMFWLKYGSFFIDELVQNLNPLEKEFKILTEQ